MRFHIASVLAVASAAIGQIQQVQLAGTPTALNASAIFFDLTSLTSETYFINQFCLRTSVPSGTSVAASIWTRLGSHVGHTASAAGWTAHGQVFSVPSGGPGSETCISVQYASPQVFVPPGQTLGVLVAITPLQMLGYSAVPPAAASYSNGSITLDCGPATGAPGFGAPIIAGPAAPAGRIRYYIYDDCQAYANCDLSFYRPALNVNDFVCFNESFAAGTSYANCDGSTAIPFLNVNDFICFLNAFVAGCSAP